ncbi:unnamed protein product, partial [Larinioides sclopetarius]
VNLATTKQVNKFLLSTDRPLGDVRSATVTFGHDTHQLDPYKKKSDFIIEKIEINYLYPFACLPGSYIYWEATDDIMEPSDRVYICLRAFKMPPPIENPADCLLRAVIRFLSTKGFKAADIHSQITNVYGENIMNAGMVRKWVRAFKDGSTNIHDEERRWRPSVTTDDLIQKVDSKVKENRRFTISSLSEELPVINWFILKHLVSEMIQKNLIELCYDLNTASSEILDAFHVVQENSECPSVSPEAFDNQWTDQIVSNGFGIESSPYGHKIAVHAAGPPSGFGKVFQ